MNYFKSIILFVFILLNLKTNSQTFINVAPAQSIIHTAPSFDTSGGGVSFYDFDDDSIFIGYTFYSTEVWGKGINPQVKRMMLDYAFQFVNVVKFHVGKENIRSRIAMERLGAEFKEEIEVAYFGESPKINIEYWIEKNQYEKELP